MSRAFGASLREARLAAGFTQQQLAWMIDVDHTYLSKIECGKCLPPSVKTLHKIAAVLGADEELLLSQAGKTPVAALRQHLEAIVAAAAKCKSAVHTRAGWVEVPESAWREMMQAIEGEGGGA